MTLTVSDLHQPKAKEMVCFPASFAQQRLWFIDQFTPGTATYNLASALRVRGKLDVEVLGRTLQEVARRHETLRTLFVAVGGEPQQVIEDQITVQLPVLDLTGVAGDEEREAEAMRLAREEAQTPFNLKQAPLFRGKLLRLDALNHVLLFTMHHIISDAWSIGVLIEEVSVLYDAFSAGRSSPLPELPIQYADYTVWQREWLERGVLEQQLAYWKQQLGGSGLLLLPTDRPRPTLKSQNGATCSFVIGASLTQRLKKLAEEQGATLFMVLLAAFETLLYRYSGQDEIAVGTPTAGRSSRETEKLIGLFVNTLVLRGDLSGAPSFTELLKRTKETALEAYAHEDVPFEKLVEVLSPERNLGSTPLFQVMIVLQNVPQSDLRLGAATLQPFSAVDNRTSKFDLSLSQVEEETGRLAGSMEYDADLFEATTVQRMIGHYSCLIASIISAPDTPVWSLGILTPEERGMLLQDFNSTADAISKKTVVGLFEEQVERTPGATAVRCEGATLTYSELDGRANQLGHYLKQKGVRPERQVGICLNRSLDMIVALLGVLKAGGAYVPLDPSSPIERLGFMLEQAQITVLVTESSLLGRLPMTMVQIVSIDEDWKDIAANPTTQVEGWIDTTNLAYVIYTSGSTGQPKGVAVTHQGMVNYVKWAGQAYKTSQGAGSPLHSSLAFDLTITSIYPALLNGGCVEILSKAAGMEELAQLLESSDYSLLKLTPSHLRMLSLLLEMSKKGERGARVLVIGGEALKYADLELWRTGDAKTRLINEYGPTETVVGSTIYEVKDERQAGDVPVGQPIVNTQIYVLDAAMEPAPVGVPGEIFIAGAGLARGYVNRADLTAERFLANPYGEPGTRMYSTGDLARWRQDGTLEFLGRADEQVKIRGFRIELGEIEAALGEHPQVRQATVVVQDEQGPGKRLVAYFVPANAEKINTGELRTYLKDRLPGYMVPFLFMEIAELPLTSNGKVDRKALPIPEMDQNATNYSAPRTVTEEILCSIWIQVLNVQQLGVEDNFFALGGHSLLATQLVSRVRKVFLLEVPLRTVFEAPTITGMAEWIERERLNATQNLIPPITRADRTQPLPLSFAQQRLWFIDQLEPSSATYNIPLALRVLGPLNQDALHWAVQEIVRRQEGLRTRFPQRDGVPVQEIEPEAEVRIEQIDLTELDEDKREQEAVKKAAAEAEKPFDLARGPLVRIKLLRLGEQEHVLLVIMHHIVSDGWSMEIMLKEFTHLYAARCKRRKSRLPELPIQYADFSIWQRDWLRGAVLEKQLGYWKQRLDGLQPLELPTDRRRPAPIRQEGTSVNFKVGRERLQDLKRLSREQGATLYMTCLAAWQALLYRYTGQEDIVVGSPIAGRRWVETEGLIGFFVNTLVLRTSVGGKRSFAELLQQVREITLAALAHQDVPFEKLVEELAPERNLGRTPFFQVMFALHSRPNLELELEEIKLTPFSVEIPTTKFDLSLTLTEDKDDLEGMLSYRRDLFEADTVQRIIRHYSMLLASSVAQPEDAICRLPMLVERERHQLLVDWNQTAFEYPKETVVDLFERQVNKAPDALAVEYEGKCLTYSELNGRANQLGRHLKRLGVGPDVRIGLYAERSIELVVGILGVLKAGGAYVPLDPNYPAERLAYMLNESGAAVLLRQVKLPSTSPEFNGKVVGMDDDWREITLESADNLVHQISGDNLAYVIYTSGSTGRPKGIGISHQSLANHMRWMQEEFRYQPQDRILQKTSTSFDASVWEFYAPLLSGGQLVLLNADGHQNPEYLARQITEAGITVVQMVPSVLEAVLQASPAGNAETTRRDHLRLVMCGGEVLKLMPVKMARKHWGADVVNLYGPTECTIDATFWRAEPDWNEARIPIGKPIANTTVYVLDSEMQPVPVGVAGELYIGGAALARGYMNLPALTAERFVPNPFVFTGSNAQENSGLPGGQRLYRTGDQVRWREDGNLDYLGRLDEQIKVRGLRIELGEIEAALREQPGVAQAVVVVYEETEGDKRLVAYVVRDPRTERFELSREKLSQGLRKSLPEYMVPGTIIELETLPQTSSGKIDRRALATISPYDYRDEKTYVAPRTAPEEVLANIWAELLQTDRIGIHDNFFELGGHSLLAVQAIARMRSSLGLEPTVRTLFEEPTIARLMAKLGDASINTKTFTPPPIARRSDQDRIPLSFAQQRLWFLSQLEPGNHIHHIPLTVRLTGVLNERAFSAALNEISRRHEILRTSFPVSEGRPYQMIWPPAPVPIEKIDLRAELSGAREENVRSLTEWHVQKAFDLAKGPLFRVLVFETGEEQHVICLIIHHIICDAWSVPILVMELRALYNAFLENASSPLPELPLQYSDVAVWEQQWLRDEALEEQIEYWRRKLEGCPQISLLPADFPPPTAQSFDAEAHTLVLSSELDRELEKFCHCLGATEFMVLLALMNVWLFRYSGQSDILIGSPVSNRIQVETEQLIGLFVNTLVFRTQIDATARFADVVHRVRVNTLEAYDHQSVPFEKLVDELKVLRDPARNPLFQVMLNMGIEGDESLKFTGLLDDEPVAPTSLQARFDIHLNVRPVSAGLELTLTYNRSLFHSSTIASMLESFIELIRLAVKNPETIISDLIAKVVRFEQESTLARKRGNSREQGQQLRLARRRTALSNFH
jgi:amino acid adenylation domain-containing protein